MADILWRNYSTRNNKVWTLNPNPEVPLPHVSFDLQAAPEAPWNMVGAADFDGDGQLDIVWYLPSQGYIAYWYMSGVSLVRARVLTTMQNDLSWKLVGVGYFGGQGDKKPDLLWHHSGNGTMWVWHMNDADVQSTAPVVNQQGIPPSALWPWTYASTGDYLNNDHTDIFVRDVSSSGQVGVWRMEGTTFIAGIIFNPSLPSQEWQLVGANHFNPTIDSSMDLLWRSSASGNLSIWKMNPSNPMNRLTSTPVAAPESLDQNWKINGTGDALLDSDRDGMPDLWERNHFGTIGRTGTGNFDGDGYSDVQEYRNGTNPIVPDSPLFHVMTGFRGITGFDNDDPNVIVPDTMGAIGPSEFLEVLNGKVAVFPRTGGNPTSSRTLADFFERTGDLLSDPRVWFDNLDPAQPHWVILALDTVTEEVIVKVSTGSTPDLFNNSMWHSYAVAIPTGPRPFADYPTLGVDANGIYFSVQILDGNQNVGFHVQAFKKPDVYGPGYTPPGLLPLMPPGEINTWAIQPAFNFDSSPQTAWFLAKGASQGALGGQIHFRRLTWSGNTAQWAGSWQAINDPTPTYRDYYDIASTFGAPSWDVVIQRAGIVDLSRGGSRLMMAVIRSNSLWTCHHVGLDGPDSSYNGLTVDRSAVQWLRLSVGPTALSYVEHRRIYDASAPTSGSYKPYSYFYPSLNINLAGDLVIGFSGSRIAENVSSFFAGRRANGAISQPVLLKAGKAAFDAGGSHRWGDYSATSIDPTGSEPNLRSFWTVQEYGAWDTTSGPGFERAAWSTWVSKIKAVQ